MQELFIEFGAGFRNKQGILRHLEMCSIKKSLAPKGKRDGNGVAGHGDSQSSEGSCIYKEM